MCFRNDVTLKLLGTTECTTGYTQKSAFLAELKPQDVSEGPTKFYFSISDIMKAKLSRALATIEAGNRRMLLAVP